MKLVNQSYEILSKIDGKAILQKLELIGRVCYKSENRIDIDSAKDFVQARIKTGHESIIEHEGITIKFITDRGVANALVRHRLASFSQESTIYCNYSLERFGHELAFIDNKPWMDGAQYEMWLNAMNIAEDMYLRLTKERNCPARIARGVLPLSTKTEVVMTANLREWRLILKQRTKGPGDSPMMTDLMRDLLTDLKKQIPVIFDDL